MSSAAPPSTQPPLVAPPPAPEILIPIFTAKPRVHELGPDKITALAAVSTVLGTSKTHFRNETPATVLSKCDIVLGTNKLTQFMLASEFICTVDPRSTQAFNNGPGGNFAILGWKSGDNLISGITVESRPGSNNPIDDLWTKTTRSSTNLMLSWSVPLFKQQWYYPRTSEYAISGRPVAWSTAVDSHAAIDGCFEAYAQTQDNLTKKKANNGPTSTMYLSGHRPVFTLFHDTETKETLPISFHKLQLLGPGLVFNLTLPPVAFTWVSKHEKNTAGEPKLELSWEYCFVNVTVLGQRKALDSPSKLTVKRKALLVNLDDTESDKDDEDEPAPKNPNKDNSGGPSSGGAAGASAGVTV
ncbi:hypothetical protein R3P38DRAFT_3226690 [Favolaschia claudopus]|uniref:Uncharacterized protein n=1 Tax=Favolaschia claudopus TaxID=2862362 RepID=A0AAV9ZUA5_9AGAR